MQYRIAKDVQNTISLSENNRSLRASFLSLYNGKSSEEKSSIKKPSANYEPQVKSDLSFDGLIAMPVGKPQKIRNKKGLIRDRCLYIFCN